MDSSYMLPSGHRMSGLHTVYSQTADSFRGAGQKYICKHALLGRVWYTSENKMTSIYSKSDSRDTRIV